MRSLRLGSRKKLVGVVGSGSGSGGGQEAEGEDGDG